MKTRRAAPLYKKVKEHILERIASGVWGPEEKIPTELELVKTFQASRMTVNRAVRELTDQGLLFRIAGVGTFVADRRTQAHPLEIRNIAQDVRDRGGHYHVTVAELAEVAASEQLAGQFGVAVGSRLFRSVLVHHENNTAVQLEDRYVNPAIAPEYLKIDFTALTPDEYLMEVAPLQGAEHILRAVMPSPLSSRLLKVSRTEPCLLIVRRTWSGGVAASYAEVCHPGSRYQVRTHFFPESGRSEAKTLQLVEDAGTKQTG